MVNEHDPSGSNDKNRLTRRGLIGLFAGAAATVALSACGETIEAKPANPPATSASPSPESPKPTPESPKPSVEMPKVEPFRDWKIAPDTVSKLESAQTSQQKWGILKQFIMDNNKPGSYELDMPLNSTRPPKDLANRVMVEMATMADAGIDPNLQSGDKLVTAWAELAIIDPATRDLFTGIVSEQRKSLSGKDPEVAKYILEGWKESPCYHKIEILKVSDKVQHFHDKETTSDYSGVTFTTLQEINDGATAIGAIDTYKAVFDSANSTVQILREYREQDAEWKIAYNIGDEPVRVRDLPEIKAKVNA